MGCWGWLWRRRRLLLLVHFALLCPPVLEPDLHLWGQRTEMGWGRPDDSERKAGPAVGLLFLDGAPGPPPTPLPQPSRDPSTTPPELAPRLLRQLSLQPSSSSSPKAMSLLLQEAFPLPPGLRSLPPLGGKALIKANQPQAPAGVRDPGFLGRGIWQQLRGSRVGCRGRETQAPSSPRSPGLRSGPGSPGPPPGAAPGPEAGALHT